MYYIPSSQIYLFLNVKNLYNNIIKAKFSDNK